MLSQMIKGSEIARIRRKKQQLDDETNLIAQVDVEKAEEASFN
jgi:hypothetical protein